jgi:hypothetical protein
MTGGELALHRATLGASGDIAALLRALDAAAAVVADAEYLSIASPVGDAAASGGAVEIRFIDISNAPAEREE